MRNFVLKFRVRPNKKGLHRILVLSQSVISGHLYILSAKWALLAKKPRGPDVFRPIQCQTRGGAASLKSTPVCLHLLYICDHLLCLVLESARKVAYASRCTFWQFKLHLSMQRLAL